MMISSHMPQVSAPKPAVVGAAGHDFIGFGAEEVTPDMVEMGAELGCPFLASMGRPQFGAESSECGGSELCKSGMSAAAQAAASGAFGLAGVSGACPHMSKPQE